MRVNLVYPWPTFADISNKVYRDKSGTHYLWPVWPVRAVIAATFAGLLVILATGCSTCPPCVPTHEVIDNPIPVYYCPEPPALEPLVLPEWPVLPDNPEPDQIKSWYVAMQDTVKEWIDVLLERNDYLEDVIDAYREPPE